MQVLRREMDMARFSMSPFGFGLVIALLAYCFLVLTGAV